METDYKKNLKAMLDTLKQKMLEDEDIKGVFTNYFPIEDYEVAVSYTIQELEEYALQKELTAEELSYQGAKLFFADVLEQIQDDDDEIAAALDEENKGEEYGKA